RLSLDAPVASMLPSLGGWGGLTIEQVLLHTSGLPNVHLVEHLSVDSIDAYIDVLRTVPPTGDGGMFSYCEMGYALLGHLAGRACGTSWYGALQARVLRPLGVQATLLPMERRSPRLVTGHTVHPATGEVAPVAITLPRIDMATGGLAMSAADLAAL